MIATRILHWWLAPFVDHWRGLSLTRLIAVAFTALVCMVSWQTRNISGGAVTLAIFSIAAAFGKSVFVSALERWNGTSSVAATLTATQDNTAIVQAIMARRDHTAGVDPAP